MRYLLVLISFVSFPLFASETVNHDRSLFGRAEVSQADAEVQRLAGAIQALFFEKNINGYDEAMGYAKMIRSGHEEAGQAYARLMKLAGEKRRQQLTGIFQNADLYTKYLLTEGDAARFLWAIDGADNVPRGNTLHEPPPYLYPDDDVVKILNGFYAAFNRERQTGNSQVAVDDYRPEDPKITEAELKKLLDPKAMRMMESIELMPKASSIFLERSSLIDKRLFKSRSILERVKDLFKDSGVVPSSKSLRVLIKKYPQLSDPETLRLLKENPDLSERIIQLYQEGKILDPYDR